MKHSKVNMIITQKLEPCNNKLLLWQCYFFKKCLWRKKELKPGQKNCNWYQCKLNGFSSGNVQFMCKTKIERILPAYEQYQESVEVLFQARAAATALLQNWDVSFWLLHTPGWALKQREVTHKNAHKVILIWNSSILFPRERQDCFCKERNTIKQSLK